MDEMTSPWRKSSQSFSNGQCAEVSAWRKSTRSAFNGSCAEVAAWRASSRSNGKECAEAASDGTAVLVRDSKDPAGPVLRFGAGAWAAFTAAARQA